MSTTNQDSPAYDGGAQTGYALGALFGMILFNVALAAVALIFRRISRSRNNAPGNEVELKGKIDKRTSNANADVESATALSSEPNGKHKGRESGNAQSAANSGKIQKDKGAFDEVDLEKGDTGHNREGTETGRPNTKSATNSGITQQDNAAFVDIDLEKDDAVYEDPEKVGEASNVYTALSDVKTEIPGHDENYENLNRESSKVKNNESDICY